LNTQQQKNRVALSSVISNSVLVVFKLVVGLLIGSVSVISEAIHSGMDLIAAIIAMVAVRISGRSWDEEHTFGHGKVENISAAVEALLIFVAAIWIIYEAVTKLISPHPIENTTWGVIVMAVSAIANFTISRMLFKVGKATDSAALIADGWHLRTDVYTSAGVMGGLAIILLVGFVAPGVNVQWIDPVAAILVAFLIFRAAFNLMIHAVKDLMDASSPPAEMEWINRYLKRLYPTIRSYHRLRTRKSGPYRFIDFHIVVEAGMSVKDSHKITEDITEDFRKRFSNVDVTLHVEPCDGTCTNTCVSGCQLSEEQRTNEHNSGGSLPIDNAG
jgi:cation diffusion facilitator family transporter